MLHAKMIAEDKLIDDLACASSLGSWLPRRRFILGAAALAAGALLPVRGLSTQNVSGDSRWIDMHHHFGPPQWCSFLASRNLLKKDVWENWTPAMDVKGLDRADVATAMVSITYPGIWLGENVVPIDATRKLARECNDYGAKMAVDYPGRFRLLAVLPLPDIDGCLREIEYIFDSLKADGVGILTSYGDKWLGDPTFAPVFEELNRRKAIVFVHSNVPVCCTRGGSGTHRYLVPGVNNNVIEYGTDTTRAIMSLVVINANERYPNIRFLFSHAGGTMPFLIERILGRKNMASLTDPSRPNARLHQLRQFHYDTANANNSVALDALTAVVGVSQILFGTDFPYEGSVAEQSHDLKACGAFNATQLRSVGRDNARRLLSRVTV